MPVEEQETDIVDVDNGEIQFECAIIEEYVRKELGLAEGTKIDGEKYTPTELTYVKPEKMLETSIAVLTAISNDDKNNLGLLEAAHQIISSQYAGFMSIYDSFNT